jgi:hypothetical protein
MHIINTTILLAIATGVLFLEILRQQTIQTQNKQKLEGLLEKINLTTKISAGLVLTWGAILIYDILTQGNHKELASICLLGTIIAVGLQIHAIQKTSEKITEILLIDTIAVISLLKGKSEEIRLWFKKTGQEWPPIRIEVGQYHITQPLKTCPQEATHELTEIIEATEAFKNKEFQEDFRKTLQMAGVTHPVDIEGNEKIKGLQTFLQETLLPAK